MMKRIFRAFTWLIAIYTCLCFTACSVKDVETYGEDATLYFRYDGTGSSTNTQLTYIDQSFFQLGSVLTDTLTVYIRATGQLVDYDRPFQLVQTNVGEPYAAIEGKHFVSWDDEVVKNSLVIKANKREAAVKIIVNRYENEDDEDNRMDLYTFYLSLEIGENEHFTPGIVEYRYFDISMTSVAVKPTLWDTYWKNYFGITWGSVKMQFIIDITGYTDWDTKPADFLYLYWMRDTVRDAFATYNLENPDNPLREADGTLVEF